MHPSRARRGGSRPRPSFPPVSVIQPVSSAALVMRARSARRGCGDAGSGSYVRWPPAPLAATRDRPPPLRSRWPAPGRAPAAARGLHRPVCPTSYAGWDGSRAGTPALSPEDYPGKMDGAIERKGLTFEAGGTARLTLGLNHRPRGAGEARSWLFTLADGAGLAVGRLFPAKANIQPEQ